MTGQVAQSPDNEPVPPIPTVAGPLRYVVVGLVVVPVATVLLWGLRALLGGVVPGGTAPQVVLAVAATFIACFAVAAAFLVVLLAMGMLGTIGGQQKPIGEADAALEYMPSPRAIQRRCRKMATAPERERALCLAHCRMLAENARRLGLATQNDYVLACDEPDDLDSVIR